jgi:Domain of unknown function (DUF4331)
VSDHLSSPRALRDPTIDLTDLYFFPVPDLPGRLAVVVNVFPLAQPGALFSDAVSYRVRLAPAETGADRVIRASRADRVTLDVTFDDLDPATGSQAGLLRCGDTVTRFRTGDPGAVRSDQVSVFAGLRRDPFFMDVRREREMRATRRLTFTNPGTDAVAGQNVLSIVIEFDAAHVLGVDRRPVWVVAAETMSQGVPSARFERLGRPEVKNVLLSVNGNDPVNKTVDLRDLYNLDDVFAVEPAAAEAYRARLDANLAMFDALDGAIAWPFPPGGHHPLSEMWLNDHLVLDTTKPFSERGYLDLERAALTGQPPTGCGGRWLNEDVIDVLNSVIVRGWDGPPIRDGVDHATIPALPQFPYLAAENPSPPDPGVPVGR